MKVLFVGDSPSKKNVSQDIAFVGTKSEKTLKKWADKLGVSYYAVNSHDPLVLGAAIRFAEKINQPVITLGEAARKRTEAMCKEQGFALHLLHMPHPSPRNRLLNDAERVETMLRYTRRVLDSIKTGGSGV